MRRHRVRSMKRTYGDLGPDLLRPQSNAIQKFMATAGRSKEGWYTRRNPPSKKQEWTDWQGPMRRGEAMQRAAKFAGGAAYGAKFQIGRKTKNGFHPHAELMNVEVKERKIGVNPGAQLVADLARTQFGVNTAGFACRRYNFDPNSGWSDHAWRDAVDLVPTGESNDKITDWCVRMAKEGCMGNPDQFIGSRNGRVYSFYAPYYNSSLGGPISHLHHVHCSYNQHYGANPGCA